MLSLAAERDKPTKAMGHNETRFAAKLGQWVIVTPEDLQSRLRLCGAEVSMETAMLLFRAADADQSGVLDRPELAIIMTALSGYMPEDEQSLRRRDRGVSMAQDD